MEGRSFSSIFRSYIFEEGLTSVCWSDDFCSWQDLGLPKHIAKSWKVIDYDYDVCFIYNGFYLFLLYNWMILDVSEHGGIGLPKNVIVYWEHCNILPESAHQTRRTLRRSQWALCAFKKRRLDDRLLVKMAAAGIVFATFFFGNGLKPR